MRGRWLGAARALAARLGRRRGAGAAALLSCALGAALLACALGAARPADADAPDPGILLDIDRTRGALAVRDRRDGAAFEPLRVATGSPAHPTPVGTFRAGRVILAPAWTPGRAAREAGAVSEPASLRSPMGVAKIPFAEGGAIALHGGGDPYVLGKPVSSGCVRLSDAAIVRLLAWLERRGALGAPRRSASGEVERSFTRPVSVRVR